jgi:hypothetical protein
MAMQVALGVAQLNAAPSGSEGVVMTIDLSDTRAASEAVEQPWSVATHCCLCGELLEREACNHDHVPPRRFYPSAVRSALTTDLLTLETHVTCNAAFGRDEEYFFNTLLPNALQSAVGPLLAADFTDRINRDTVAKKLSETVKRQFEERPGGLVLPGGLLLQEYDSGRVRRVVWKIVRGLFAVEHGLYLREDHDCYVELIGPFDSEVPPYFVALTRRPRRGHTPSCFGYTYTDWREQPAWEGAQLHLWLLELWETYRVFVSFHDPACSCARCPDAGAGEGRGPSATSGC